VSGVDRDVTIRPAAGFSASPVIGDGGTVFGY
jgi:hypothetical protein